MTINAKLVFDIDGVIAYPASLDIEVAKYIHTKGAIIKTPQPHYLFPGVLELIQVLAKKNISAGFYSFGRKERNENLTKALFTKANLPEEYINKIVILSKEVFVNATLEELKEVRNLFGDYSQLKQKDLDKILREGEKIENCLMMEDTWGNLRKGQISNLLYITKTTPEVFSKLAEKKNYNSKGFTKLKISLTFNLENLENAKKRVENANDILIYESEETYKIAFLKLPHLHFHEEIVEDADLINQIKLNLNAVDENCEEITSDGLAKKIYSYVKERKGKTNKVCRKANRIFYATGLFFSVLEQAQKLNITPAEALFKIQYQPAPEGHSTKYQPNFSKLWANDFFYLKGLEILREVNPQLEFNTPKSYEECLNKEVDAEEFFHIRSLIQPQSRIQKIVELKNLSLSQKRLDFK